MVSGKWSRVTFDAHDASQLVFVGNLKFLNDLCSVLRRHVGHLDRGGVITSSITRSSVSTQYRHFKAHFFSEANEPSGAWEHKEGRQLGRSPVDSRGVTLSRRGGVSVEGALCRPLVASHLLLVAQEVGQLVGSQVVLPVAVGHHQQEDVPPQGHHLVEDGKLLVGQRTLLVVGVGLLRATGDDSVSLSSSV